MAKAAKKAPAKATKLAAGTVRVDVKSGVSSKSIHALLDEIFKQHGCLTCGLGGIDIHIRPLEVIQPNLGQIEGVVGVSLGR